MDHPRWQKPEPGCRAGPAPPTGFTTPLPGAGASRKANWIRTQPCLVLHAWLRAQPLLDPPSWSTEGPVFIPTPEKAARATTLAGKRCWGFPSAAPRRPPTPVLHPLRGRWWLLVTTMAIPVSLSPPPALLPEHWGSIPVGLGVSGMERTDSGHFRNWLGCYFHAESHLQLFPGTDKWQLRSPPAQHPAPAPGRCAVSAGCVGAAGKVLLQGRRVRM